eukprot:3577237-Alexandrium_andersonii.AAC.1
MNVSPLKAQLLPVGGLQVQPRLVKLSSPMSLIAAEAAWVMQIHPGMSRARHYPAVVHVGAIVALLAVAFSSRFWRMLHQKLRFGHMKRRPSIETP